MRANYGITGLGLRTIVDTGPGPFRIKIRIEQAYYRALYSKSDWNKIVRASLLAGGMKWMRDYLPLRFQPYARVLGYNGKKKRGLPLVVTGRLRAYVMAETSETATAKGGTGRLTINIPTPEMTNVHAGHRIGVARTYAANPIINQVLSTVTAAEVHVIDNVCQQEMAALILGSELRTVTHSEKFKGERIKTTTQRMSLSVAQRSSLSESLKQSQRRIAA